MKIAVATDDGQTVSAHAGRCQAFYLYETPATPEGLSELTPYAIVENKGGHHHGGPGHGEHHAHDGHHHEHQAHTHATLAQKLSGVEVLLCKSCGPRLIEDLQSQGIRVQGVRGKDLPSVVRSFFEGTAKVYDAPSCGHHH
jgi:predicted Fe-Mo cluster-binding NifX family protein